MSLSILLFIGCSAEDDIEALFHELSSDVTNITFTNTIEASDSLNALTDHFLYNGAGVAVGDLNNDGLPDLFFSGNIVSSRLYLNEGDMRFRDITAESGIYTDRRITGASMVDINSDGYLDIYLSVSGAPWSSPDERRNLLFLNNGDNTFREAASEYFIDDPGFTTHAVFLDYNRNGYLDLFLLGNSPEEFGRGDIGGRFSGAKEPNQFGVDKLYRNNGDGTFTDVSQEAGIVNRLGYGLGVVVTDLNNNGWPDIYVSNDITPNDVLYINNQDGTFTDRAKDFLKHTSFAGMGIDIADFTNNGWPDIIQTDMMPESLVNRKRMSGSTSYSGFQQLRNQGYFPHYNLNTLQYNQGVTRDSTLIFSEIGRMAGISYTDWSWAALFADFDNDGFKDLFISNGYPKAVNDFDYLSDMHRARQTGSESEILQKELDILDNLHSYNVANRIFKNNGDLTFTDKTNSWGMDIPGFSYGTAYADLNNNGRLDLIINNINSTAQLFENRGTDSQSNNYIQLKLRGENPNRQGIGSKIVLSHNGKKQTHYHTPYRGYMSTVHNRVHFGLGNELVEAVDSIEVYWPDGRYLLQTNLAPNQIHSLSHSEAVLNPETIPSTISEISTLFEPVKGDIGLHYKHTGNQINDFNIQPLLPYQVSKQQFPIAVGDVTGNGLDDLYIGGAADQAGSLYVQQNDGTFITYNDGQPWDRDRQYEDWGTLFFDANGNGLMDLYVASGSFRLSNISELLQDRLYINQGNGRFIRDSNALPNIITSTSTVKAGDFNGDGQPDLFVGGRLSPRNYPQPVRSYILQNIEGRFTDVTSTIAPDLEEPGGMITDAAWVDYNGNERPDLVTVGDWMPIQFYENNGQTLTNVTHTMDLPPTRGWWNSLEVGDFNNDGHPDLVAGNLGLNFTFSATVKSKFSVYAHDFNDDWMTDLIFVHNIENREYTHYGLAKLGNAIPQFSYNYSRFETFATEPIQNLVEPSLLQDALHYQVDTFASMILINNSDGTFTASDLPHEAQISPIFGMISNDFNGDGNTDLLLAGNLFETEPNLPRADAGNGLLLKGDGNGYLSPVAPMESGFYAPGDVKKLVLIKTANGPVVYIANYNELPSIYQLNTDNSPVHP